MQDSKRAIVIAAAALVLAGDASAEDWPDWRGPSRDGKSAEKGLPERWSPAGENLAWKAPYGARSTPVVAEGRVYLINGVGAGATLQERLVALDAGTGKLLWEHRWNVFHSDVPPHRIGWSSPVVDRDTGNVYAFGVGGTLLGLTRDGKRVWERSLAEEFGLVTTHGGRTVSPIIEGDLVIVSGVTAGWGAHARAGHRFLAFDKKTGGTVWVNSPGGRPFDTTYSPPIAAEIAGTRLVLAGGSDGAAYAFKPQTGEVVWRYEVSKRGLNTGVLVHGTTAIVTHSEENLDSSEMGMMSAIDATAKGAIGKEQVKWRVVGWQGGFSSPVLDGDHVYQVDNGANLAAFDATSGKRVWLFNLGTIQKASPVLADGKLYVGSENGRFWILKPGPDKPVVLDEDQLGTEQTPEAIIASVAVGDGHVYLATMDNLYCIGPKGGARASAAKTPARGKTAAPAAAAGAASGKATYVQVVPTEVVVKPGESVQFHARLFDENGRFLREAVEDAAWGMEGMRGAVNSGHFTADAGPTPRAGQVTVKTGGLAGAARVRIVPPLPWEYKFDEEEATVPPHWINATGKFTLKPAEGGGTGKVLVKNADNAATKRARVFMGPTDGANYTVEADVLSKELRRQMGDAGVVAQRYQLALFGNHQRVELNPWQPETARAVTAPFTWKPDTWYRLKLRVENLAGGQVKAMGKVWPVGEAEPAAWLVERTDPVPNRQGSPGIYADASVEVFFDNVKVVSNQ
jgi:outer membrane protein assembly factor BamB